MIIFPAIDLIDGQCVRLTRGDFSLKKEYSPDPVSVAMQWKECGARWIHVVDLDGARTGRLNNFKIACLIKESTGLMIEYGGGIRDLDSVGKVIESGIDRVVVGTSALEDTGFLEALAVKYKQRFILSLDFNSSGKIFKHGWQSATGLNIFGFLPGLRDKGIEELIVTNISRDGTLGGIDLEIIKKLLKLTGFRFVIAGGVSGIEDVIKLKAIEKDGISGLIIGKALYEGKIDLKEAIMISGGDKR